MLFQGHQLQRLAKTNRSVGWIVGRMPPIDPSKFIYVLHSAYSYDITNQQWPHWQPDSTTVTTLHWNLTGSPTVGGMTMKEMRNFSGPEVIQVSTPASAVSTAIVSIQTPNATADKSDKYFHPIRYWTIKRGRSHEFADGKIHGASNWQILFLLIHRSVGSR